jgi:hypothetical protein
MSTRGLLFSIEREREDAPRSHRRIAEHQSRDPHAELLFRVVHKLL